MVDKLFNPLTLLVGPVLVAYLAVQSARGNYHLPVWNIVISYLIWLMSTRTVKLLPHLWNRPQDIIHVPAFIAFGYYFAIMKLYALFTLHEVGWGTRAGIGDATQALTALNEQNASDARGEVRGGAGGPQGPPGGGGGPPFQEKDEGRRYDPEAAQYAQMGNR